MARRDGTALQQMADAAAEILPFTDPNNPL